MFELLIMRHAKSDWNAGVSDHERPLNKRGRKDASHIGDYLYHHNLLPDDIVSSTSQRTRETLALLMKKWPDFNGSVNYDRELYLADLQTLLENIQAYARPGQRLMLVAHNPGVDELVEFLCGPDLPLSESGKLMVTAAVAHIEIPQDNALVIAGQASLKKLLRPKELD